jgi:hypothetical protein
MGRLLFCAGAHDRFDRSHGARQNRARPNRALGQ